ncbi:MAG: hypothetical protein WAU60_04485 [Candidatus Competibacter denitrificans]
MGIIDQSIFTLKCVCGVSESIKILQHGSAYGGSWQSGKPMTKFAVTWEDTKELSGPNIKSAQCNACGRCPEISIS